MEFPLKCNLHLLTLDDLRRALTDQEFMEFPYPGAYRVRSDVIVNEINRRIHHGEDLSVHLVRECIAEKLGIEPDEGALRVLVYNAFNYVDYDRYERDGCVPLTRTLLEELGEGAEVEFLGKGDTFHVRVSNGLHYLCDPGARNYGIPLRGQPVKVIKRGTHAKE